MPNIGIAICNCGNTLLTQENAAQMMANITCQGSACEHVFHVTAACTDAGRTALAKAVKEQGVEKLVFAGCSPIRNQTVLESIASQTGLTPSAVHGVNIKEHIFLRAADKAQAIQQASKAIQKTVNAVAEIPVFEMQEVPLHQDVLILGGGTGGIAVAQELQRFGYAATIVERTSQNLPIDGLTLHTGSTLRDITGNIGNFSATIATPSGEATCQCGAVVVASGIDPTDQFSPSAHIVSLWDIERTLRNLQYRRGIRTIGLVLDLKIDETKASTEIALKMAQEIQGLPRYQVYLFCRDMRVAAKELEELYDEARNLGVNIVKYEALAFSEIPDGVNVTYTDAILREELAIFCDLVGVSPSGISVAADSALADMLKLSTDAYGQFQDNNIHLFPGQTNRPGVFVVGSCRGQYYVPQILVDAKATALEIHQLLAQKILNIECSNAVVDADKCALCLTCIRSCPYHAMQVNREKASAESLAEVCQKCGICAGECPAKAITLPVYSDNVILSQTV